MRDGVRDLTTIDDDIVTLTNVTRIHLRPDLEVYRQTGKAPQRKENGLRSRYYTVPELAPLLGVGRVTLGDRDRACRRPPDGLVASATGSRATPTAGSASTRS